MTLSFNDFMIFGGVFVCVALLLAVVSGGTAAAKRRKRIERIKNRKNVKPKSAEDVVSLRRKKQEQARGLVALLMKPLPDFEKLGYRLERAGVKLGAKQFLLRCVLAWLLIIAVFILLKKPVMIGFCLGIIFALWLPLKVLDFKISKHQKKFLQLMPDGIDLIVRGLRSGLPVSESINLVAQEVPDPVGGIFKHVADTMKLGVPMEKALQEVAKKLDYTEFNFFVTSIILQRETGGNLSEILNNLGQVLRARFMMKMKIKAMTSEARASSMIIGSLPFIVSIAVFVMSKKYIMILFLDYRGNIALAAATFLLCFGIWSMNRMAKFEI